MCEAPAFHQGPRPFIADFSARSLSSPRFINPFARANVRFHCRQITHLNFRRIQPSNSSKIPFTSANRFAFRCLLDLLR